MSTFYFMRYDQVIGSADDPKGMLQELKRLETTDPEALLYHIHEGHIKSWLSAEGYSDLARAIDENMTIAEVVRVFESADKPKPPARKKASTTAAGRNTSSSVKKKTVKR